MDMLTSDDGWAVGEASRHVAVRPWAAHWNGRACRHVPVSRAQAFLEDVEVVSTNDVWAVGLRNQVGRALIEHWDGSVFTKAQPAPVDAELRAVSASAAEDVWTVGHLHEDGLIYHWDGGAWHRMTVPHPGGSQRLDLSAHWDGTTWSTVRVPHEPGTPRTLDHINAVAADDVWASGTRFEYAGSTATALLEHWDGTRWSYVPPPNPGEATSADGLAPVSTDDVWCGVAYLQGGGVFYSYLAHWDGSAWTLYT